MPRGGTLFLTTGALAMAACSADAGRLDIRPIADPLGAATKAGNPMVAEGRSLLALGSIGLAIEAFRKAIREQPDNIEALGGLAECYERMGRYDVARQKYEEALAVAPNNSLLLNTFAASLERQGLRSQAAELRAEAAAADAASIASLTAGAPEVERMAEVPQSLPAPQAPAQPVAARQPAAQVAQVVAPKPPAATVRPLTVGPAREVAVATKPMPRAAEAQSVGKTEWTFELPEPSIDAKAASRIPDLRSTKVAAVRVADLEPESVTLPLPAPKPAPMQKARPIAAPPKLAQLPHKAVGQPRLERLSLGEVALLTTSGPMWTPKVVAESRQSVTVRFVPLRQATASSPNIRVLNAARRQGLAAMHRDLLLDRGWRRIAIGDAPQVREQSLVLYPADRRSLGRSLAAQFGFRSAVSSESTELVVLLGRDAWSGRSRRLNA